MPNAEKVIKLKQKINEVYGELPSPSRSYLVCSSPRTGTNLIGFGMKEIGYGWPLEGYNLSGNKRYGWGHDESDIVRYTRDMMAYQTSPKSGVFGLKLFWEQFLYLEKRARRNSVLGPEDIDRDELLAVFFDQPYYIFLRRKNKIKQAISYVKALQSDTFLVPAKKQAGKPVRKKPEFVYDNRLIEYFLEKYVMEDMLWERFFSENRIQPYEIWYEDFVQDYQQSMHELIDFLDLDQVKIPSPYSKKQADSTNQEWYQRFLSDHPWIEDPEDAFHLLSEFILNKRKPPSITKQTTRKLIDKPLYYLKRVVNLLRKR